MELTTSEKTTLAETIQAQLVRLGNLAAMLASEGKPEPTHTQKQRQTLAGILALLNHS